MTMINTTALRANGFAFVPTLTRMLETAIGAISAHAKRRATARALEHLTDRELDDIGLTRWDVNSL